ncbi:MAG: tetratricopeptide repeat protein [Nocardioidaceae bacterium]
MSERNDKPSGGGRGDRPGRRDPRRPGAERSSRGSESGSRSGGRDSGDRSRRGDTRDRGNRPRRGDASDRRSAGQAKDRRDARTGKPGSFRRDDRDRGERSDAQMRYDGPPIPEDITGNELHRSVKAQLRSLPEKLGLRVARHLVAAARVLDSEPEVAYQHTLAARARAARIAMVREACGEAAYAAGHFKDALTEFKAARRMNGSPAYLPMMADCERALGRPERALALAKDKGVEQLDDAGRAEMTIVEAGARRDAGDVAAALRTLEGSQLRSRSRASWAARLRYAYADTLLAADRVEDARIWFERAAGVDADGVTDAAERLAELEGLTVVDLEDEDE